MEGRQSSYQTFPLLLFFVGRTFPYAWFCKGRPFPAWNACPYKIRNREISTHAKAHTRKCPFKDTKYKHTPMHSCTLQTEQGKEEQETHKYREKPFGIFVCLLVFSFVVPFAICPTWTPHSCTCTYINSHVHALSVSSCILLVVHTCTQRRSQVKYHIYFIYTQKREKKKRNKKYKKKIGKKKEKG